MGLVSGLCFYGFSFLKGVSEKRVVLADPLGGAAVSAVILRLVWGRRKSDITNLQTLTSLDPQTHKPQAAPMGKRKKAMCPSRTSTSPNQTSPNTLHSHDIRRSRDLYAKVSLHTPKP